ncbi:hypothetical protein GW17_00025368 [Ensete ventricosum]|nr:hypothetical protein GW17_00025368 [Ensete ventricosum]
MHASLSPDSKGELTNSVCFAADLAGGVRKRRRTKDLKRLPVLAPWAPRRLGPPRCYKLTPPCRRRCRERGLVRTAWTGGRPSGSMARSTSALGVELPEKAARPLSRSFASSAVHVSTRLDIVAETRARTAATNKQL